MPATEEELTWARTIKSAAAEKGVSGVTDFEYLQHGIVSKGNVEKSLKRIERLATFRKQYALKGYSEDNPRQLMESLNALCPGFFPGLGRDGEGHAVLTSIYRDFDPSKLSSEKDWRDLMGAFYYLLNAMCADADGIRAGVIFVCDCKGLGWNNFSLEAEKRAAALYQDAYAVRFKHMFMLDAPLILNSMIAIVKVFLSKKIRDTIETQKSEDFLATGKMPAEVLPPKYGGTATEEKKMQWFEEQLAVRIANENSFSL